jgi:hypothetical protein
MGSQVVGGIGCYADGIELAAAYHFKILNGHETTCVNKQQ